MHTTAPSASDLATHNGMVTILNTATGQHRTFRVQTERKGKLAGKRVVSLLTGPDNESSYTGFAFLEVHPNSGNPLIYVWKRLRGDSERSVWEKYARMLERPSDYESRGCEYLFESRCRVCNQRLTTPESIERGIGPVCSKRRAG